MEQICAIILAAGRGTRLNLKDKNKVVLPVGGKSMILYAVDLLENLNISPVLVVVGFAKESVKEVLKDRVTYVDQKEQQGTGSAVMEALSYIPSSKTNVLVIQGDDSLLYAQSEVKDILKNLILNHTEKSAAVSLLTNTVEDPHGFGRIVRDENGLITKIIEEKDATPDERHISEVNPGCYVFALDFLTKNIHKLKKSSITGELYLTDLIELAYNQKEKIESLPITNLHWHGINTPEDLEKANKLFLQIK